MATWTAHPQPQPLGVLLLDKRRPGPGPPPPEEKKVPGRKLMQPWDDGWGFRRLPEEVTGTEPFILPGDEQEWINEHLKKGVVGRSQVAEYFELIEKYNENLNEIQSASFRLEGVPHSLDAALLLGEAMVQMAAADFALGGIAAMGPAAYLSGIPDVSPDNPNRAEDVETAKNGWKYGLREAKEALGKKESALEELNDEIDKGAIIALTG